MNHPHRIHPSIPGSWATWLLGALVAVLFAFSYHDVFMWLYDRWIREESYYSHGFLVPPLVLFLIWRDRRNLLTLQPQVSYLGLSVMLAGLFLLLVSGYFSVFFTAGFGMILTLWGLCGFTFGRPVMRRLSFPMFLMVFMVPLPLAIIAGISLKMKLMAASAAVAALDLSGVLAVLDGSTVRLETGDLVTVGYACSGLRSLISLIFLGLLFAFLSNFGFLRRMLLFLSSIPIAIFSNMVRVYALCLIAYFWGSQAIHGLVHDISGYMIFVVAFISLFLVMKLLSWPWFGRRPGGIPAPSPPSPSEEDPHEPHA